MKTGSEFRRTEARRLCLGNSWFGGSLLPREWVEEELYQCPDELEHFANGNLMCVVPFLRHNISVIVNSPVPFWCSSVGLEGKRICSSRMLRNAFVVL